MARGGLDPVDVHSARASASPAKATANNETSMMDEDVPNKYYVENLPAKPFFLQAVEDNGGVKADLPATEDR